MRVLVIRPHEHPVIQELPDLEAMRECVGGPIQAIYPWPHTLAALVCDEEGLYHDSEWNRYICEGVAIKGTFFICGLNTEDFDDLPDDLVHRFEREFHEPQLFMRTQDSVVVIDRDGVCAVI